MADPYKNIAPQPRQQAGRAPAQPAAAQAAQERATPRTASPGGSAGPIAPDSMEASFRGAPARRPAPTIADPLLQWATGLQTDDRRLYAGWLAEVGQLDELDRAAQAAGIQQITIRHGSGNKVRHWALELASLFVICEGAQTIEEMKHTSDRYGIAFGWRTLEGGRRQSVLRARVFVRELLLAGYEQPLQISMKSTLTGDMIAALMCQYAVLDQVDDYRRQDKRPPLGPPFYAVALPIAAGQPIARGSGDQRKEISPPAAQLQQPISRDYIRANWLLKRWAPLIESLVDQTVAWSRRESAAISANEEPQQAEQPALEY